MFELILDRAGALSALLMLSVCAIGSVWAISVAGRLLRHRDTPIGLLIGMPLACLYGVVGLGASLAALLGYVDVRTDLHHGPKWLAPALTVPLFALLLSSSLAHFKRQEWSRIAAVAFWFYFALVSVVFAMTRSELNTASKTLVLAESLACLGSSYWYFFRKRSIVAFYSKCRRAA
jgi:hypothetical protein